MKRRLEPPASCANYRGSALSFAQLKPHFQLGLHFYRMAALHLVMPAFRLDAALERAQIERLRQTGASRSRSTVEERLAALEQAARDGSNLMPPILEAAEAYATVGEISGRLKTVFGEYREA